MSQKTKGENRERCVWRDKLRRKEDKCNIYKEKESLTILPLLPKTSREVEPKILRAKLVIKKYPFVS